MKASETAADQLKQGHGPKGKGFRPEERTGHKEKAGKFATASQVPLLAAVLPETQT